jgi:predicted peptidase
MQNRTLAVREVGTITYGISVPPGVKPGEARPLILALHPGGDRTAFYGSTFARQIVIPALVDLGAIVVAPDCPTRSWSDAPADAAVMALIDHVRKEHAIDARRVLVTGFSLGGRGTWSMVSRHADLFTAAIPMAASVGNEPVDRLGTIPTYIIHSRDDQVVPFEQAERNFRQLEGLGRAVRFEALEGVGHFQMGGYIEALRRAGGWVAERWNR